MQPCGTWATDDGHVIQDGCSQVEKLLSSGFVPVLHGDGVLDKTTGCKILSGDIIIQVTFVTSVTSVTMNHELWN